MLVDMDATREPASQPDGEQHATTREERSVTVRRSPKYGAFMAIGAVVGILVAWLLSSIVEPAVNEAGQRIDTTAVIGLVLVIGFVVGAAIGGGVASIVDRALAKGTRTMVAERVETLERRPDEQDPEGSDGASVADAGEAAFERLDADERADRADGSSPEDDRPRGA